MKTRSITIPVLKTPEAFVMRYINKKIGFNIMVEDAIENKNGTFTVPLTASIPSFVRLENEQSKTFVYTFKNIGNAIVKYQDYDYDFVERPNAPDLDSILTKKLDELTLDIQKEILDYGKYSWGKLSTVKYWLGSIHDIILRILKEHSFVVDNNTTPKYKRYFDFLKSINWIEYDKGHKDHVSAGNKLTKLYEEVVKRENSDDMNLTAEVLLGHLFASHYTEIRDDLNIRAPSIYVTTTKAYYADAVREGKPIRMNQETLWFKYRTYSYNPKSATHRSYRFPKTVDELISHDMLRHAVHDSNDIVATPDLLKRLMPYQEELAKNVIEI